MWATPFILFTLLLLGGWLNTAPLASAQGADTACNPAGDDNELLYCVWTVEPRFGGMSVDQSDATVLRVLLTGHDPTDGAAARVLAEVNRLWDREFAGTTVVTADYTVGQLKGWFDTVAADFHELMTGVDLDEAGNRITVMVADLDEDQDTVAEHIAGLGVPHEAVQFEEFQLGIASSPAQREKRFTFRGTSPQHTGFQFGTHTLTAWMRSTCEKPDRKQIWESA